MEVFWLIFAAALLAWGLIMLISPKIFWTLARVDWNADVVDTRVPRHARMVRAGGALIAVCAGSLLAGLLLAMFR